MERLTVMTDKGAALVMGGPYKSEQAVRDDLMARYKVAVASLAAYEDTGMEPDEIELMKEAQEIGDNMTPQRLAEILQAEWDGRLVVLPCKVGDTIYKVVKCCGKQSGFCFHASCDQSHDQCQYWIATVVEEKVEDVWDMSEVIQHLGETIFLTRREAEEAVERKEEGPNADPSD